MLFAPSANHTVTLQQQLSSLQHERDLKDIVKCDNNGFMSRQTQLHQSPEVQVEQTLHNSVKSEERREAMMKLDAKLVAYLAGGDDDYDDEHECNSTAEDISIELFEGVTESEEEEEIKFAANRLQIFKSMSAIKLHMEALTLQAEGTKRMELLQSEIRPIFTVECQLSHELIRDVPRYEMFHIMQFESEKFQSLTQCTRFGQEAERNVQLRKETVEEDKPEVEAAAAANNHPNFGRIHFTVWWREPGTCLNEMLGMGLLELHEMYNASVLQQCKCIAINRRGVHLANIYLKVSLQVPNIDVVARQDVQQNLMKVNFQQCCGGGGDNKGQCYDFKNDTTPTVDAVSQANENGNERSSSASASETATNTVSTNLLNNNNTNMNNTQVETSDFMAETSKVRLLKGFICANETRNFEMTIGCKYFLVCRRFWQDEATEKEPAVTTIVEQNRFNYQEQFSVINDEEFLQRVNKKYLQLELWRCQNTMTDNGNGDDNVCTTEPVGIVLLPLHQFYIAYKDSAITNHLCKGKMPVISIDNWTSIMDFKNKTCTIGELKCLLAIGSDEQITNLKDTHGIARTAAATTMTTASQFNVTFSKDALAVAEQMQPPPPSAAIPKFSAEVKKTSDLLDMLQRALMTKPTEAVPPDGAPPDANPQQIAKFNSNIYPASSKDGILSNSFRFQLDIQRATGLPKNPLIKCDKKSGGGKSNSSAMLKRYPANEAPSTYVTFQADQGYGRLFKSHEGMVYATSVVEKSTKPEWLKTFCISANVDYLTNRQKQFILKIWKKAASNSSQTRLQPAPINDALIGFVALDMTAFSKGHIISGWLNIIDFNGRTNGQLQVRCAPIENLHTKIRPQQTATTRTTTASTAAAVTASAPLSPCTFATSSSSSMDEVINQLENSLDLTHLNLGQAIKRKFTELETISQRLRTRLVDVTGEPLSNKFDIMTLDNWQSVNADDDELDEFERDLNTVVVEYSPPTSPNPSKRQQNDDQTSNMISSESTAPKE